jgi:RHS repeat-associated protein
MKLQYLFTIRSIAIILLVVFTTQSFAPELILPVSARLLDDKTMPLKATTRKTKNTLQPNRRALSSKSRQSNRRTIPSRQITLVDYKGKPVLVLATQDQSNPFPQQVTPINFTYNPSGLRATMTDASGTTTYTYDNRDRLINKQTPFGTLTYTYDAVGNVLTVNSSNANGISLTYSYDALNRLKSIRENQLPEGANLTTYVYQNVNVLDNVTFPNGITTTYGYDSQYRITSATVKKGTTIIASYTYSLGPAGNRIGVQESGGKSVTYSYDNNYRLKSETIQGTLIPAQDGSISYSYDNVGNRLNQTSTLATIPTTTFTYDDNDRLTSDSYDNNGNTIMSNGLGYVYDFENKLVGVIGGPSPISIIYDGDGNRVSKTIGSVTTQYLVDNNNPTNYSQVVEELQNGNIVKRYTYGYNLINQIQLDSQQWEISYFGYDGHGSVRLLIDDSGAITDTYDYDAWGNLISRTGNTPNNYLYAGEQFDADLGFYYLRARYMNPVTGRFLTTDKFEGDSSQPLTLHKYLYANANPVNNIDPSGNRTLVDVGVAVAVILTIVTLPTLIATRVQAPTNDAATDYASNLRQDAIDQQANALNAIGLTVGLAAKYAEIRSGQGIGATNEPRGKVSPFNPQGATTKNQINCAACVGAVLKSVLRRALFTADQIESEYGFINFGSIGSTKDLLNYLTKVIAEDNARLTPKPLTLREPGSYVLVYENIPGSNTGHTIFAQVFKSGKVFIYDPQNHTQYFDNLQKVYNKFGTGKSFKLEKN